MTGYLGTSPTSWPLVPLRYVLSRRLTRDLAGAELLSVYREHGVIPKSSRDDNYNRDGNDLSAYLEVQRGDLVINKMKAWQGSIAISAYDGIVSPAYFVFRVHPSVTGRYLHHLLRSSNYVQELARLSSGVRPNQWDLDLAEFGKILVPLPPPSVQHTIADFLDHKAAAIDVLIEKKERSIALLGEKQAALIHQLVTKGLNPDAPVKDSGVPWIGTIPRHWDIHQLRRVVSDFIDYRGRTPEKSSSGIPLITAGAVRNGVIDHDRAPEWVSEETFKVLSLRGGPIVGDLLFTSEAPLGEIGLVVDPRIACAQRIILFRANRQRILPEYLRLHFLAETGRGEVRSRASGATAEGIRADRLRMSLVPTPPANEQRDICNYVEAETQNFSAISDRLRIQIDRLREYRQALITAAVTGQLTIGDPSL